jgi:hypothetical protein
MTKKAAFGTLLKMGTGLVQVETATVAGTITQAGNATVIITAAGMTGSPLTKSVAVSLNDTAAQVAGKIRAALALDTAIMAMFTVEGTGADVVLRRLIVATTDATLNIATDNGTCLGLTAAPTSTDSSNSEIFNTIGQVEKIGGPNLSLDTEDATTLDQETAWEEVVATILRSGEVTLDLLYDPNLSSHKAVSGLIYKFKNKLISNYQMLFPGGYEWDFTAFVVGFNPGAPHNGKLSASTKLKISGAPTLY